MNVVLVFLVILVVLIIIAILIDKSNIFKSKDAVAKGKSFSEQKKSGDLQTNAFLPYPTWSQPISFPPTSGNTGSNSGLCNIYTFLGGNYTPGVPSYQDLNNEVKNNLTQPATDFVCIDPDQLFANTVSHECINPQGLSAGSGCILTVETCCSDGFYRYPGEFASKGTVEGDTTVDCSGFYSRPYYAPCTPGALNNNISGTNYCMGSIGVIIPEFNPQPGYNSNINTCIGGLWPQKLVNQTYKTFTQECDLADSTQIFRIIRYSLDNNNNLYQDDNGILAAFVHRYTGYYLSPDFGDTVPIGNGATGYKFNQPIINYGDITDNTGNTFKTHINTVLINPAYDTIRNGVYWLLQNQTSDPVVNPQLIDFPKYGDIGIIPTQDNYAKYYTPANANDSNRPQTVPSYFIDATVKLCESNPSNPGCVGTIPTIAELNGATGIGSCFFGVTPTIKNLAGDVIQTGTTDIVSNVPFPQAPQQIVYIPDLNLLPNFSTANPSVTWTYLINNYSLNLYKNNDDDLVPILTPYRQSRKITVAYNCVADTNSLSNNGNYTNFFTQLTSVTDNIKYYFQPSSGGAIPTHPENYEDAQFIKYASFIQQIQTPVSQNYDFSGSAYASNSNPFNI